MNMSSNIKKISDEQIELFNSLRKDREENAKVIEKTSMGGFKRSVVEKYSEHAHFIYELLQNADDTKAKKVRFVLEKNGLLFAHNGEIHFSISDPNREDDDKKSRKLGHINSITSIGNTNKFELQIGKFGVGFKAVFEYTNTPHIYDPPFLFKIARFIVPVLLDNDHQMREENETLFYFPFDIATKEDTAYKEINEKLSKLNNPLLFLRHLEIIEWKNNDGESGIYSKPPSTGKILSLTEKVNGKSSEHKFLVFDKDVENTNQFKHTVSIAFKLDLEGNKVSSDYKFPAYCFFHTHESTELKFIVHAPFLLTDSREGIKDDKWNQFLIKKIAELVSDSLPVIREMGLLTLDFLNALPISKDDFPEDHRFRPVYEAVLSKLKSDEKLLPTNEGNYISAKQAFLAEVKGLINLLDTKQLSLLFGKQECQWLNLNITQDRTPDLKGYLVKNVVIEEITPEKLASEFTEEFIKEQSDEWIIKFYTFLKNRRNLWGESYHNAPLRSKPFIRLEKNAHVAPFDISGKPQAYLPGNSNSDFPTVKKVIANDKEAREFLKELKLDEPNLIAEVIESILPKYQKENSEISNDENLDDVKKIIQALKIIPSDRKEGLVNELKKSNFLIVVNPSVLHQKYWCKPDLIYLTERFTGSEILDKYFEGNPDINFLDEMYNDFKSEQLLELGCLDNVRVTYRKPNYYGHIDIQNYRGHHKRGLNGFDPDCEIEGLGYALEHITVEKARIIWNILKKYYKSIYGTVESSARQDYGDRGYSSHKEKELASKMGELVREKKWLPDKQGNPHKPSEILLSDLLDDFDDKSTEAKFLAEKLGFNKDIEQEIRDSLPTEKQEIWDMLNSSDDEDIQAVKQLLDSRKKDKDKELTAYEDLNYKEELEQAFNCPQIKKPEEDHIPPDTIPDPNRRRELTQAEIQESIENEPPVSQRFKRVPDKIWEQKNNKVRPFLKEQYGGKCQICDYVFYKRDGEPYFEGSYFVSMTKASWIDKPGNVLCLCANCCAKFKHGQVEVDEILDQINKPKWINEDGTLYAIIKLKLCGEEVELKYSERHILYLQEILKASIKKTITQ